MRASLTASCQLLRSCPAGFEVEEDASSAQPLIARCFLYVSAPPERSEQARLRITALPPQAPSLVLEIPLVRHSDIGFLYWFECSVALLPGIPLRFTVHDPALIESGLNVVLELVKGRVRMRNEGHLEAFLDEQQSIDEEDFWFNNLGYTYLQAPWLLQLGAYLVQHHHPGDAYQMVRYLPDRQIYEYRLHFVSATGTPQDYLCLHNNLNALEWEHALVLDRFALGFPGEPGLKRGT